MKKSLKAVMVVFLGLILSTPAAMAEEFLVGIDMPLTGSLARVGNAELEGIKVAVEMFNRQNPNHTIKIMVVDNESQPDKSIAAVEKLASQGVVAIDGGYGSNNIGPASEAAAKANLVYITSGGVAASLLTRQLKTTFTMHKRFLDV